MNSPTPSLVESTAITPSALTTALRTKDFPDWLSPVLVKELRQGTRSKMFSLALILLHSFLLLSTLAAAVSYTPDETNFFFWFFVGLLLLGIQPLRAINSLSIEYDLNTIELVQLTRLNAWRITLGKWLALNAQTLLLVTSLLPYMAMRYFLGNQEILQDFGLLFLFTLASALASAVIMAWSAFQSSLVRIVLAVGVMLSYLPILFSFSATYGPSPYKLASKDDTLLLLLLTLSALYGCFFFLSLGASRIAPPSENHATRKRLMAFAGVTVCILFLLLSNNRTIVDSASLVGLIILSFALLDALTEPLPIYRRVLVPFRRNPITRFSAWFLSPGWLGGIGFLLCWLFIALCILVLTKLETSASAPSGLYTTVLDEFRQHVFANSLYPKIHVFVAITNVFLFPLLILHLFLPRYASGNHTFGIYLFIQIGQLVLSTMTGIFASTLRAFESMIYTAVPIPMNLYVVAMEWPRSSKPDGIFFVISIVTLFLCISIPLLRQRSVVSEFVKNLYHR